MIVPLASRDLVASGAKYDGCFNLTICGNRYRSFVRKLNDNPYVDIERLSLTGSHVLKTMCLCSNYLTFI